MSELFTVKLIFINRILKNITQKITTGINIPNLVSIEKTSSVITDPSFPIKLEFVGAIIVKKSTPSPPLKKELNTLELFTLSSLLQMPIDNPARTKVSPTDNQTLIKSSSGYACTKYNCILFNTASQSLSDVNAKPSIPLKKLITRYDVAIVKAADPTDENKLSCNDFAFFLIKSTITSPLFSFFYCSN